MIEAYLRELGGSLPSTRRTRFLREAEAHLEEHAAVLERGGVARGEAERRAVEAFGPVDVVAAQLAETAARVAVRRASGVTLVGLLALVAPLYLVPENLLPPAPWVSKPAHLAVLQGLVVAAYLAGLVAAAAAVAVGRIARPTFVAWLVAAGLAGGVAACSVSVVLAIAWAAEVPGTSAWIVAASAASGAALALSLVAGGAVWTRERAAVRPRRVLR